MSIEDLREEVKDRRPSEDFEFITEKHEIETRKPTETKEQPYSEYFDINFIAETDGQTIKTKKIQRVQM